MHSLSTTDAHLTYIPFQNIDLADERYRFRLDADEQVRDLIAGLKKSGQSTPIFLSQQGNGSLVIVDGHLRCEAIRRIREHGVWEKMLAQIFPVGHLSAWDRFRMLRERNMQGKNAFGLVERGRFFKQFLMEGIPVQRIAAEMGLSVHDVEDLSELTSATKEISILINHADMSPAYALMLLRRYEGWIKTTNAAHAGRVAEKLVAHLKKEPVTMKSWRFLLDFYWDGDRPFMS